MYPDLFSVGPLTLHTYGLLAAIGFFVALGVTVRIGKSQGFTPQQITDMGFIMILSALIGSRVLYVLMNLTYYSRNPLGVLKIWEGGLVFSGGILAVILTMIWYSRGGLSLLSLGDLWAPGVSIGQAVGRLGCLLAGCCYGRPTDSFWGITFTDPHSLAPAGVALHPTQIYSFLSSGIIFLILLTLSARKKFTGQVFFWFLILHSTSRLYLERFRGDDRGVFLNSQMTLTQFVATVILLAAVVGIIVLSSRKSTPAPSKSSEK